MSTVLECLFATTIFFSGFPSVSIRWRERGIRNENVTTKFDKFQYNCQLELLKLSNSAKLQDKDDTYMYQ